MINVQVNYSGKVQEYAGEEASMLRLPDGADVALFFRELTSQKPSMKDISKFLFVSVNGNMAPRNRVLQDGDEINLFFRMGGG